MEITKKGAVYMDHFTANIIEYYDTATALKTIELEFSHAEKEHVLQKGEIHLHNKEQGKQIAFYKKLQHELLNYDEIVLFGPTTAKTELYNIISADADFNEAKITLKNTDKLTKNQQIEFINDCFYSN
jgi:stalled ribosome rescue protein Dom34